MTKIILSFLIAAFVGGMSLYAEDAPAKKGPGIRGSISAIDTQASTVTIAGKNGESTTLTVNDKTKISIDKKDATLADLKVGDKVGVRAEEKVATRIYVMKGEAHGEGKEGEKEGEEKKEGETK